jgi:hypothetical protein
VEKSGDLQEWVLRPLIEVRDRVRQLPGQVQRIAHAVTLLEILLDLEIAEMRACLGEISPAEARIVGMRVAATVTLPDLARRLARVRERAAAYEAYLARLDAARDAGDVRGEAYAILVEEYRQCLQSSEAELASLESRAEVWRRSGHAVLNASVDWVDLQLDVLTARRRIEQRSDTAEHHALLQRERTRLDEARRLLTSL